MYLICFVIVLRRYSEETEIVNLCVLAKNPGQDQNWDVVPKYIVRGIPCV